MENLSSIDLTAIVVAVVTSLAAIIQAYINKRDKHALKQATQEMNFQKQAFDYASFFSNWDGIQNDIKDLMENTSIDRFLLFQAWNGAIDPKWTTCIFQIRQGAQEPVNYIHFELDDDYRDRLKEIAKEGRLYFNVESVHDCAIKRVYQSEGVLSSLWVYLNSEIKDDGISKRIAYCSFSSHTGEITKEDRTRCEIIAHRLKALTGDITKN